MPQQPKSSQRSTISRRAVLQRTGLTACSLSLAGLAGCSSRSKGSGGGSAQHQLLDPTKGIKGGKMVIQAFADPGGSLELVKIHNAGVHELAGFTHDGLLEFWNGTPAHDGYDIGVQPNLAQAMPEQPDQQTYVYRLRPAKFHNGRAVVADDVKYSYERYAFASDSAYKTDWSWLDSVSAPDATTIVVKTDRPYADALQSMAQRLSAEILCREHQESAQAEKALLGSGPFLFVDYEPPVRTRYKRNPDYHRQPYPYLDEIELLGTSDPAKKLADFLGHNVNMTYWFPAEERDQIKKGRPDAQVWPYLAAGSSCVYVRTDKPPFNDKRVRQALSMAIDRKTVSQAVTQGEGEPDQVLSISGKYWGFRKPSELGSAAKYWNYDPQQAHQLLAAAGVDLPIRADLLHFNASVLGQKHVDQINLIEGQWRQAGIFDAKDVELSYAQAGNTIAVGNYDAIHWYPNTVATNPDIGITLRNQLYWPPEGIKGPPTQNTSYINDPQLSALAEKQLGQFDKQERIQTFRQMEDILAEQQYRIACITNTSTWFGDPSVRNMQPARDAYQGAIPYVKYWWFDKQ